MHSDSLAICCCNAERLQITTAASLATSNLPGLHPVTHESPVLSSTESIFDWEQKQIQKARNRA